jgi:hypothetical protein
MQVYVNIFDIPHLAKSISGLVIIKMVKDAKKISKLTECQFE